MMRAGGGWSLLCIGVCVACAGPQALRPEWRAENVAALRPRMAAAQAKLSSYSAEVRLTYFGNEGRMRGTASIAAMRPNRLRYELLGPHGGVLAAFASNGSEFSAIDFAKNKYVYGRASAHALDQIMGVASLHLDATAWVSLLFGEIAIPDEALLNYDTVRGLFLIHWRLGDEERQVWVDPETARVKEVWVRAGGAVLTHVEVSDWDERGLPVALHLSVPDTHDDVELKLRDLTYDPSFDDEVFELAPPRGAQMVRID